MSLRMVTLDREDIRRTYDDWLSEVSERLDDPSADRNGTVRDLLLEIYGTSGGGSLTSRVREAQLDPRNVTLEAEYYGEMDEEKFYRVKPLLWLWRLFDRSPIGQNVELGIRFRRLLAGRVFGRCGRNVRIFPNLEVSFGYNIHCGDNVTIHRDVMLDDRGEIVIGDDASISDFVSVYSHSHHSLDIREVQLHRTVIGEGARVTVHATVLPGCEVGKDAVVGALGVVTRNVHDHHIAVGIPAKSIRIKKRTGLARSSAMGGRV